MKIGPARLAGLKKKLERVDYPFYLVAHGPGRGGVAGVFHAEIVHTPIEALGVILGLDYSGNVASTDLLAIWARPAISLSGAIEYRLVDCRL